MMNIVASKLIIISVSLISMASLFVIYMVSLHHQHSPLQNENFALLVRCSLRDCSRREDERGDAPETSWKKIRSSFRDLRDNPTIGLVNMAGSDAVDISPSSATIQIQFDSVSPSLEWNDLFPGSIDEESDSSPCPEIPMPDFSSYDVVDVVVASLPCRRPEPGWTRDVHRLQVHLVAANLAVRKGVRDQTGKVRVALKSKCRPMMDIFRCDDLVRREGEWWMYEVEIERLEVAVALPVGSCKLALDLGRRDTELQSSKISTPMTRGRRREAYATVLHSSDRYVCGAIVLAQSILKTGTARDLVLLHDSSIPVQKLQALSAAGWKLRLITRIRNPHAKKDSYNEYNYSKLRLWQLTDYHKIIFVDSDLLILRNVDVLFRLPEISAAGNHRFIFNSGVMVIEPSNCTFEAMMGRRREVISYNGGDQGFLNEVFAWWHRFPKRANALTFSPSNKTTDLLKTGYEFGSGLTNVYGIHYLGLKPWACYRDYDCNWNRLGSRRYANDVAHWRWWTEYDRMDEGLKGFCGLSRGMRDSLERDRREAAELKFEDDHWKLRIHDPRKNQ